MTEFIMCSSDSCKYCQRLIEIPNIKAITVLIQAVLFLLGYSTVQFTKVYCHCEEYTAYILRIKE